MTRPAEALVTAARLALAGRHGGASRHAAIRALLDHPVLGRVELAALADAVTPLERGLLAARVLPHRVVDAARAAIREDESISVRLAPPPHPSARAILVPFGREARGRTLAELAESAAGRRWLGWLAHDGPDERWREAGRLTLTGDAVADPTRARPTISWASATTLQVDGALTAAETAAIHKVAGRRWDGGSQRWLVPAVAVEQLVKAMPHAARDERVDAALADEQRRTAAMAGARGKADTEFLVPTKLPLYAYQKVAVEFAVATGGGVYFADGTGLGKTAEVIGLAEYLRWSEGRGRTLVFCKASNRPNWCREIVRFAGVVPCVWTAQGPRGNPDARYHVATYDNAHKIWPQLQALAPDLIACDEAHYRLANPSTLPAKAILGSTKASERAKFPGLRARWRCCVSATPVRLNLREAYPAAHWLDPLRFPTLHAFLSDDGQGGSVAKQVNRRLQGVMIRRSQMEVYPELPPKTYSDVWITPTAATRHRYDEALRTLYGRWVNQVRPSATDVIPLIRAVEHEKVAKAHEILEELRVQGRQALVFSQFKAPLIALRNLVGGEAAMPLVTGDYTPDQRQASCDRFEAQEAPFIGATVECGAEGLNLKRADTIIFLDLWWVPTPFWQAEGRSQRVGTELAKIHIVYLLVEYGICRYLREQLDEKGRTVREATDGTDTTERRAQLGFDRFVQDVFDVMAKRNANIQPEKA